MKRFLAVISLFVCSQLYGQVSYTSIVGSSLKDAGGNTLTRGLITFAPVDQNGNPMAAMGVLARAVSCSVSAGVIGAQPSGSACQTADALASNPKLCYSVTILDSIQKKPVPTPGETCSQPTGSTWSYDTYLPNSPSVALIATTTDATARAAAAAAQSTASAALPANGCLTSTGANLECLGTAVLATSITLAPPSGDATSAINAALAGYADVTLSPGIYTVRPSAQAGKIYAITMPAGTHLHGTGTIKVANSVGDYDAVISGPNCTGCMVEGIAIDANVSNNSWAGGSPSTHPRIEMSLVGCTQPSAR